MSNALQTIHRWIKFDELSHFAACILDKDNRVVVEVIIIIVDIQYSQLRSKYHLCLYSFWNTEIFEPFFFFELQIHFYCWKNRQPMMTSDLGQWLSISETYWWVKQLIWNDNFSKQFLHYSVDRISRIWKISFDTKVRMIIRIQTMKLIPGWIEK